MSVRRLFVVVVSLLHAHALQAQQCTPAGVAKCARQLVEETVETQTAPAPATNINHRQSRIIGGQEVCPSFDYPHMVPLIKGSFMLTTQSFTNWFCGGTLYNRTHVITAAHCMYEANADTFDASVLQGLAIEVHRHDLSSPLCTECSTRIAVASVAVHPDYDPVLLENDIAVLRLATAVPADYETGSVVLDSEGSFFTEGQPLIAAGWGATSSSSSNPAYSEILNAVEVEYIDRSTCTSADWTYSESEITTDSTLSASSLLCVSMVWLRVSS